MAKRKKNGIRIKTGEQIEKMREAGRLASEVLVATSKFIEAGKTTKEVDEYAGELIKERGGVPTFLGYRGFPGNICISMNEEVVHGIGGDRVIVDGDLVSIDIGVTADGWIGDNATTVPVGPIDDESKRLLAVTEQSLYEAISHARAGVKLAEVCGAVEDYVKKFGMGIVKDLVGHGVGSDLHEEPQVPNYRPGGRTPTLKAGMILAIEPMINAGVGRVKWLDDGWTVISADKKMSAHFEHTVLITDGDPELLTFREREALPEMLGIEL